MTNVEFYGKNVNLDKIGIVLVDMQYSYLKEYSLKYISFMREAQKDILQIAVNKDYPLGVLEFLWDKRTDSELRNLINNIPRKKYFKKEKMDGFSNEKFYPWLKKMDLETLCFMGIHTNQCVLETAKSAKNYGFNIMLAKQLTKGIASSKNFFKSINWFRNNGVYPKNYKEIVELLNKK
ncbi:MAG TPA: isochorismatase family protein [Candidatus Nanoarchaeia archaeon]|nr:isochorismatase family protein [Candidatus Nanoarchaeia archaeon]